MSTLPHQQLAIDEIKKWWKTLPKKAGLDKNGYVEMPTGSGKTYTTVQFLADMILKKSKPILWIAHSNYLLKQAEKTFFDVYGSVLNSKIGYIQGSRKNYNELITFATIQTLSSSDCQPLKDYSSFQTPHLVIHDEFHHCAAATWGSVINYLNELEIPILGLSATPTRTDPRKKQWLQKTFSTPVVRIGMTELIKTKVLARPNVFRICVDAPKITWDAKEVKHIQQFHDVPESILVKLANQTSRNKQILQLFKERKDITQAIVFCCNVDHAIFMAKQLIKNGISAQAVTGSSQNEENQEAVEKFCNKELQVLTSVILLTEGVDLPNCDTVILARPTQSEILLKQMMGRAMRGPAVGGKAKCLIIDFVDVFKNFVDVSGTSFGFTRGYNGEFEEILKKPPTKRQRGGMDLATLLRIRDWMVRKYDEIQGKDLRTLLMEEIEWVIEFFDKKAGICRSILVPKSETENFKKAAEKVQQVYQKDPTAFQNQPIFAANCVRKIYDKYLGDSPIAEEDIVDIMTEGIDHDQMNASKMDDEKIDSLFAEGQTLEFFPEARGIKKLLGQMNNK